MRCLAAALAPLLLAGCLEAPLHGGEPLQGAGIRSATFVEDDYLCSPALYAQDGCVLVRLHEARSQCVGGAESYIACALTLHWNATVGAAPGRLVLRVEGPENRTDGCDAAPGGCRVPGNLTLRHRFTGPDQRHEWSLALEARLEAPAGDGADFFRLGVRIRLES